MLVFGRNVAKDLIINHKKIKKIYLQDGFHDKELISMIENAKLDVEMKSKREMDDWCDGIHQGII